MISPRSSAPKHGGGKLIVDGTDVVVHRKAAFAFFPKPAQEAALLRLLARMCEVHNAGLQERRDAYRMAGKTVTMFEQYHQIKDLKYVRQDVLEFGIQPLRSALKRLDESYSRFLRQKESRAKVGFPRFKSWSRYDTACWDEAASWKLITDDAGLRAVYVQGVGDLALSKKASKQLARLVKRGGIPATLTITRKKAGTGWAWRASVGFKNVTVDRLPRTGRLVGVDRGATVTLATSDGDLLTYPQAAKTARETANLLGELKRGKQKGSRAWKKIDRAIARERRAAANLVDNWARDTASEIVAKNDVIALEELSVRQMTKSARGTIENPGTNVAQKAGLNRSLQDAALTKLATRISVKAEEAGRRVWLLNPRNTSRTCPACGHVSAKNRPSQAVFCCVSCGYTANADVNAGVNIAVLGAHAEAAWRAAGSPLLKRHKPRLRRHKADEPATA